ncbi:MAG: sulfurtransferase TusA family protein [Endomicrobiales bacterium]
MSGSADEYLDLSGVPCPQNSARALLKLETMAPGQVLELIIDDGEPYANVPPSLEEEGHTLLSKEKTDARWRLRVRCR